jgi:hypothetical protein
MVALAQSMQEIAFSDLAGFTDKQWEATDAADQFGFTLFGGARGPGKSYWLRWYTVRYLLMVAEMGYTGVRGMLACEDYPTLYDRQICRIEEEFPVWLGAYHKADREFVLHPRYGRGVIALRNLDNPSKYAGAEFAIVAVDELTRNPLRTFDLLRGSKRWPGLSWTKFVAATNPNGRYAPWVRQYWIEHEFPPELASLVDQFVFVPGRPQDNPYLIEDYWHELETLPPALKRAWVDGDWYASIEGLVYPEFGAENLTQDEPNPELPIELAFDDGYVDPRAILFIQRTGSRILVFDEIYHSRRLAQESVHMVVEGCEEMGWPLPELAVGSPEAVELREHFRRADIPARGSSHKVVDGIQVVRRLICDGQGYRALKVHTRCRNLIQEMTQDYKYPEVGTRRDDEKPLDGNDHACDALRYWCWLRAR